MSEYYTIEEPEPIPERTADDNTIPGPGWIARRDGAACTLSWDGGGIQSADVTVSITEPEFEQLRENPDAFEAISAKYDPNR